jgi:DNA (cytosine-5)-methyltransferase 1
MGAYTSIDLFAGAGGFTLGLEDAGFRCVGAIEVDPVASASFARNFGDRPASFLGPNIGDVRTIQETAISERLYRAGVSKLDLLVAGVPCQGFSWAGRATLDWINATPGSFALDDRNGLYIHAVRILRELRPRFVIFENVPGMLNVLGRNVAEDVCDAVTEAGYVVRCTLLNAAWYGVPQIRERIIIVAARDDLGVTPGFPARRFHATVGRGCLTTSELGRRKWRHPEYVVDPRQLPSEYPLGPAVTVSEALDDLPPFRDHLIALRQNGRRYRPLRAVFPALPYAHPPRNWYCLKMRTWNEKLMSVHVTDHFCRWTPRDFETFARMKPGDRYPMAIQIAKERYQDALALWRRNGGEHPTHSSFVPPYRVDFPNKWRKLVPDAPSWTITAHLGKDTYSHIHHDASQARTITPREAARLQSFPDAFEFAGNMGDMFRQIGNAVPPLLARELGVSVRAVLAQVDGRACAARW